MPHWRRGESSTNKTRNLISLFRQVKPKVYPAKHDAFMKPGVRSSSHHVIQLACSNLAGIPAAELYSSMHHGLKVEELPTPSVPTLPSRTTLLWALIAADALLH